MSDSVISDIFDNETAALEKSSPEETSGAVLYSDGLEMGCVELFVKDVAAVSQFYVACGLAILSSSDNEVVLGSTERAVVRLIQSDLPAFSRSSAGLYHLAIVFASRGELAKALKRVFDLYPHLYQGSADHLVSEAFYFSDPEGNGVELYLDRDASGWKWKNGMVVMDSLYLDEKEYIAKYEGQDGSDKKKLGHMHLQIGNIDIAREFYVGVLGFVVTAEFPSALFLSDGKYHHHIGMNTWHSAGAGARKKSLGLRRFEVVVSDTVVLAQISERLRNAKLACVENDSSITVSDPWENELVFRI